MRTARNNNPNLGEDFFFFFLENTLILGRKLKIRRLNLSEDLFFFFFRDHHDFRTKLLVFRLRISDNFFVISEMYYKIMIWANVTKFGQKLHCPPKFFGLVRLCMTSYCLSVGKGLLVSNVITLLSFSMLFFLFRKQIIRKSRVVALIRYYLKQCSAT